MVEITNLSLYWINTPENLAARYIESVARDYFTCHDEIEGFFIIVPSIYTFDRIRNDIDIAIFGGLSGMTAREGYQIDSFAMIIEVKSHPEEDICIDSGHHYHVMYRDGIKDVTRQALSEALSLKEHLNDSGIECDFVVPAIFFRSITQQSLSALQNRKPDNALAASFTFAQLLDIIATQFKCRDMHDPLKVNNHTRESLLHLFRHASAPAILRSKFELLCSESLDPCLDDINRNESNTVIKGRAGTGKTLLLLKEALNLAEDPENELMFLTYNHALLNDIKKLVGYFPSGKLTNNNFKTIDSFFQGLMLKYKIIETSINPDKSSDYRREYRNALKLLYDKVTDKQNEIISPVPTHFLIDEAQDLSEYEKEILCYLYPASSILAAEGIDQLERNDNAPEWTMTRIVPLGSCRRMFSNVAMFVNNLAERLQCDWHVDCRQAFPGGKVMILDNYDKEIHDELLERQRKHGCDDYDMLMLVGRQHSCYQNMLDSIEEIYDGRYQENRKNEPCDNQPRLYYYQSCRGVEGWTVVCLGLDTYYEEELIKKETSLRNAQLVNARKKVQTDTALKMMTPLTRAIHTLVIVLSGKDNNFSKALRYTAEAFPDFVTFRS